MQGKPLKDVMEKDTPIREYAVFGYHGSQVDVTDGRYVYMHSAVNPEMPVYEYTLSHLLSYAAYSYRTCSTVLSSSATGA